MFYLLLARGWLLDGTAGVLLAGAAALAGGLLYGKLEAALHARLRPLARVQVGAVWTWPVWVRTRQRAGPPAG